MRPRRDSSSAQSGNPSSNYQRIILLQGCVYLALLGILGRLFYWQIIKGPELKAVAESQYTAVKSIEGDRGIIFSADGHILVGNKNIYTLFAQPHILKQSPQEIATRIAPILLSTTTTVEELNKFSQSLTNKMSDPTKKWVALQYRVTTEQKNQIQALNLHGIGFDTEQARSYPEASMAAQLLGFVGKNEHGKDVGYFGIEGKLDLELRGKEGKVIREQDAHGAPIILGNSEIVAMQPGRDITLTIRRDLQFMLEDKLKKGIEKYGAVSGEAVIMDPRTGNILAMASFPNYAPEEFYNYPAEYYKNPLAAEGYEPGSTFKVLTVAAGIDAKKISPETTCTRCGSARKIGGFTIKTWNDQYTPNISMTEALAKSDNTAMIFIAEELGKDVFVEYLKRFKIGEKSGVELQEDASTPFRQNWKPIDLATSSFGQGIATTGLQMMRAVGTIANEGKMMRPKIVQSVKVNGDQVEIEPEIVAEPISATTAKTVTDMMVAAAHTGEAKWAVLKDYSIAGKTGTAQIPVAGHYDEEKTIASFIGFAPAYNPEFVMLVKLREPQSSQWASETAAPLWYDIAKDLFIRLNIAPDRRN